MMTFITVDSQNAPPYTLKSRLNNVKIANYLMKVILKENSNFLEHIFFHILLFYSQVSLNAPCLVFHILFLNFTMSINICNEY